MKNKTILILLFLLGNSLFGFAQKVNLSNFFIIPNGKQILLYWTIDSGPTCNGITVWHSTDSVNYVEIGDIGGICGSSSSAIPYNFTDKNPTLNQTNFYKIRLGYSQFSEVKTVQINYTEPGKLIIKPNPSSENVVIEFNNEAANHYQLTVTNSSGNTVYTKENISESKIELNTTGWSAGTYYVTLAEPGGKKLKDKLIIIK